MDNNDYTKEIINNFSDIITVLDINGKILYESGYVKDSLGYDPKELEGKSIYDFIYPDDIPVIKNVFKIGLTKIGTTQIAKYRFKNKQGEWIHLESKGKAVLKGLDNVLIVVITRDITSRIQLEQQANQSQLPLQILIDLLPVRIFWKDVNGKYLGCNKALADDIGMESAEDVIGKTDYDLPWKEQADLYIKDDKSVILSGISKLDYEEETTTASGKKIWVKTDKIPLRDSKDKIYGVLGTYIDITASKNTELEKSRSLQELESKNESLKQTSTAMLNILEDSRSFERDLNKFRLAIENTDSHVIMTDPNGYIIYSNKAAEKLTGYTFTEMKGQTPRLWGRQMSKDFYVKMWDTIKNKKQPFEGEIINKNKKGELYPVAAKINPVTDETGKIMFFVGNERDISAEKKLIEQSRLEKEKIEKEVEIRTKEISEKNAALITAQEEISKGWFQVQTEKARLLASVSSIPLGFIMFDNLGKLLLKNPAFEKTLGISSFYADIDSMDIQFGKDFSIKENFIKCMSEKQTIDIKQINYNNRIFHILYAPVIAADNNITALGVILLIQDITEAKILERSKDEFFSIASHELRTPLTAIRGNTSLIKQYYSEKLKDKDLNEMIDDIHASSERLIEIVNDFLNVSRLEQGKMVFKPSSVNLVEMAQSVIKEYQTTGSLKMLYLTFDPPKAPIPNVYADSDKTRQVIINLIGNSLKYTDKGGVTVSIEIDGGFVKLLVSDTGRGIAKDQQNLLFKSSFRPKEVS